MEAIIIHKTRAKFAALIIAFITLSALLMRIYLLMADHSSLLSSISHLSQFFTILTNFLVMVLMFAIALDLKVNKAYIEAILVAIIGVGIVYHLLLAQLWNPQGLAWLADQGVHTLVPLLTFIWWLLFLDKSVIKWKNVYQGALWPLVYVFYALFRAEFTGFYPYPFLNLNELGWTGLLSSITGLTLLFLLIGLCIKVIALLVQKYNRLRL